MALAQLHAVQTVEDGVVSGYMLRVSVTSATRADCCRYGDGSGSTTHRTVLVHDDLLYGRVGPELFSREHGLERHEIAEALRLAQLLRDGTAYVLAGLVVGRATHFVIMPHYPLTRTADEPE